MAIIEAQLNRPLNIATTGFIWTTNNVILTTKMLAIQPGAHFGNYSGSFAKTPLGNPTGTITSYYEDDAMGPKWEIRDIHLDAGLTAALALLGGGNDALKTALMFNDEIYGSNGADVLVGYDGIDFFAGAGGNDIIIGNDGADGDTVLDVAMYLGSSRFYTISVEADGDTIVEDRRGIEGIDAISAIDRVAFEDITVDLTWLLAAHKATVSQRQDLLELYVAFFNRAPDAAGIAYWATRIVEGMTLEQITKSFFVQVETQAKLPPSLTTAEFVTKVYDNTLGRAPDAGGLAYWVNDLDYGSMTRDKFLLAIINGARAIPGNPDAQYLANKGDVGKYFALTQGLGDVAWATQAMANVNGSAQSVAAAKTLIDTFAARAETTAEAHLLLPLIGLLHELA